MASAWDIGWGGDASSCLDEWLFTIPHPIPTPPPVLIPLTPTASIFSFLFSTVSCLSFPWLLLLSFGCGCCLPCWPISTYLAPAQRFPHQFSEKALLTFYSYSKRTMFSDLNLRFFRISMGVFSGIQQNTMFFTTNPNARSTSANQQSFLQTGTFSHITELVTLFFNVDFWFENEVPATLCYCSGSQWLVL